MSILDLGNGPSRPSASGKSKKAILGLGLLVAVLGIGSTLASTISINANQAIEFGQGVQQSVYCGDGGEKTITVTPASAFSNSETGTFGLKQIQVSEIPDDCSDMNFVITVYGNSPSSLPQRLAYGSSGAMELANIWWANGCTDDEPNCRLSQSLDLVSEGYALISKAKDIFSSTSGLATVDTDSSSQFTVYFDSGRLPSNDVRKIVIETQEDTFGFEQCVAARDCTEN
ncbi:hypothetical protein MCEMRE20_00494 [Candidatus Nanopelagicaceae bacterium]